MKRIKSKKIVTLTIIEIMISIVTFVYLTFVARNEIIPLIPAIQFIVILLLVCFSGGLIIYDTYSKYIVHKDRLSLVVAILKGLSILFALLVLLMLREWLNNYSFSSIWLSNSGVTFENNLNNRLDTLLLINFIGDILYYFTLVKKGKGVIRVSERSTLNKRKAFVVLSVVIVAVMLVAGIGLYLRGQQVTEIDLVENTKVTFTGLDGKGEAEISANINDYNYDKESKQYKFLSSIKYEVVDEDKSLSNGDTVLIKAIYSQALADEYHIKPTKYLEKVKVKGLGDMIEKANSLSKDNKTQLAKARNAYIDDNEQYIITYCSASGNKLNDIKTLKTYLTPQTETKDATITYLCSATVDGGTVYFIVLTNDVNEDSLKDSDMITFTFISFKQGTDYKYVLSSLTNSYLTSDSIEIK